MKFSEVAYILCFRNVVIGVVTVHWGLASRRELSWRQSVSKTHQVTVLLETCGHCWLAGFGRLLQITFLFDLPTHCRIPVVLDSIISSAQKYITYEFYKQKISIQIRVNWQKTVSNRDLFFWSTNSVFNCFSLL